MRILREIGTRLEGTGSERMHGSVSAELEEQRYVLSRNNNARSTDNGIYTSKCNADTHQPHPGRTRRHPRHLCELPHPSSRAAHGKGNGNGNGNGVITVLGARRLPKSGRTASASTRG